MKNYYVIGLMSGTSIDGVDLVYVNFSYKSSWSFKIINSKTYKVTRGQIDLKLGPIEFRLLKTFMEKPARVWSREELLDRIWGRDVYVETRTVDVHFGRLRKELSRNGGADPIRTVRGVGYSLR